MTVLNPGGGGGSATITGTMQGTAAARPAPAAAPAGALYFATDTGEYSLNNLAQTAWQALARTGAQLTLANGAILSQPMILNSQFSGSVDMSTVGAGLKVAEGANAKQGTIAAMIAGSIAVANTSVTASSRIFVCRNPGGTNPGAWYVSVQTAGTGFTAASTNAADTGTGVFMIFEPG